MESVRFLVRRNEQTVTFWNITGTVAEMGDAPDIEQTTDYHNRAGMVLPVRDFLIDGRHVRASNLALARQALRQHLEGKAS